MKILLVSNRNPHFDNTNVYRERAIKALGHEVVFFDDRDFFMPGRIRQRVELIQRWDLARLNRSLIRVVRKEKPDLCLAVGGFHILPEALSDIKALGVRTALWTTDVPAHFDNIIETAPLYDRIFCAGTEAVEVLAAHGIEGASWLPFACDPEYHKPVSLTDGERRRYGRDIAFVGAYYPNRWDILKELGEFDLGIWGPGWSQVAHERGAGARIQSVHLNHSEWVKIYSAAKIVIVIHYQDGRIPCYQASPKLYEALACGAFVLVDRQKDVFSLFEDGKHLAGFDNVNDLKEKIRHYLASDHERRTIAARGREETLAKHTYVHRMREIVLGCMFMKGSS